MAGAVGESWSIEEAVEFARGAKVASSCVSVIPDIFISHLLTIRKRQRKIRKRGCLGNVVRGRDEVDSIFTSATHRSP